MDIKHITALLLLGSSSAFANVYSSIPTNLDADKHFAVSDSKELKVTATAPSATGTLVLLDSNVTGIRESGEHEIAEFQLSTISNPTSAAAMTKTFVCYDADKMTLKSTSDSGATVNETVPFYIEGDATKHSHSENKITCTDNILSDTGYAKIHLKRTGNVLEPASYTLTAAADIYYK